MLLKLSLDDSEYRIIMDSIEVAKSLFNQFTSQALEMICQDWMEYKGATPELACLEDHISYLEKILGVKLKYDRDRKGA